MFSPQKIKTKFFFFYFFGIKKTQSKKKTNKQIVKQICWLAKHKCSLCCSIDCYPARSCELQKINSKNKNNNYKRQHQKYIYLYIWHQLLLQPFNQPSKKTLLMLPFKCLLNTKQKKPQNQNSKIYKKRQMQSLPNQKKKNKTKTCENSVNRFAVNLCAVLANVPNLNAVLHIRRILWPDTMMVPLRCAWTP